MAEWDEIVKKWDTSRDTGHKESEKRLEKKGTPVDVKIENINCPKCGNKDDLEYSVIKTTEEILFMGWRIKCPKCTTVFYTQI